MNHVDRLKRSGRTQQLQPVPENARSAGKGASSSGTSLTQSVAATLASFALSGMVTLLHALRNRGVKRGVAALCIGGGEATAIAVELA